MHIVNILPHPQFYAYATEASGGRTLKPGEHSQVLPFDKLLLPALWADIRNCKIQFVLDKKDNDMIKMILRESQRALVTKPPLTVKPSVVPKPAPVSKPLLVVKPSVTVKPSLALKPAPVPKPPLVAKPSVEVKPSTASKPALPTKKSSISTTTTADGICQVYTPADASRTVEDVKAAVEAGQISLRDLNRIPGVPSTPAKKSSLSEIQGFMGGRV